MRILILLFLLVSATAPNLAHASVTPSTTRVIDPGPPRFKNISWLLSMKAKEIEKITGRKLTLKEKIILKLYKNKLVRKIDGADLAKRKKFGIISLVTGVLSFALLFIPGIAVITPILAAAAIIFGIISLKGNTNVPAVVGLSFGIAFYLVLIIALIVLTTTWSWGWD